jgi:hypothetical protein
MIPMLPCTSIDEIAEFGQLLGLQVTYRQVRPNPYLALAGADGLELHYFALENLAPEDSYSTCGVVVDDPGRLFEEFAAGLRAKYGKLPMTGYPRITRTRRRKNAENRSGFSLVDPAGNWIRVMASQAPLSEDSPDDDPLTRALDNAVVLADSHGDVAQAHKILAGALARHRGDADPEVQAEAEAFLAELRDRSESLSDQPGD